MVSYACYVKLLLCWITGKARERGGERGGGEGTKFNFRET